ncbi:hypothetical protein J5N97_028531 [Dioscorea zingiberensis]|uniref:Dof zinc finger protein n=1 Tax=Dioscorea zingiberensis TaxID=325984 RepID=A0A9D5H4W5_9LILI|nr:hypothetical protein J5N97_028531 [Dioscorea zingiberensis]
MQELLSGVIETESKLSFPLESILSSKNSSSSSSSPSPLSSSSSSSSSAAAATTTTDHRENLRCPRCDSSNTKFCYYNNYNLTQPRHFCKTCRRYWTKGGALRNIPIGGGCRKAKPIISAAKSNATKPKPPPSDHSMNYSTPLVWHPPHSSQLLTLLRASSIQNPNPNPNPSQSLHSIIGYQMATDPMVTLNTQSLSLEYPIGQPQHGLLLADNQIPGIQELYQKLRSSAFHYNDELQGIISSVDSNAGASMSSTMAAATVNGELLPISSGDQFGYWNPTNNGPLFP